MTITPPADITSLDELTDEQKAYGDESQARHEAFGEAWPIILKAGQDLHEVRRQLFRINHGRTRHRSISQTITKIEEAMFWLNSVTFVIAPHDQAILDLPLFEDQFDN